MPCLEKWKLGVEWSRLTVLWNIFRSHRSAWFPMLTACSFSEFDTSVICNTVLLLCLGSFLLVARFVLRLKVLAQKGQRLKYSGCENNAYFDSLLAYIVTPRPDIQNI